MLKNVYLEILRIKSPVKRSSVYYIFFKLIYGSNNCYNCSKTYELNRKLLYFLVSKPMIVLL